MRLSKALVPTLREDPAEAEALSHKLMLRAGLVRQLAAGIYAYLPLGQRVIDRINAIIREEMNAIGGQEITMPVLHPAEIWQKSGRWDGIPEMFKLKDRKGADMCLGMTHEEVVAWLAAREIRSYRDLPQIWYQIQTKERDEARPRSGVLRTREFLMKDSYTLDPDLNALERSYAAHERAYRRIFDRCGLAYHVVQSDTGMMGGLGSHEFMAPSAAGEDEIALCGGCGYAANVQLDGGAGRAQARAGRRGAQDRNVRRRPQPRGRPHRRGQPGRRLPLPLRRPAHGGRGRGVSRVRQASRRRARDRDWQHLQARHEVLGAARRRVPGRAGAPAADRDGQLRYRTGPDRRGGDRTTPRRRRGHLAPVHRALPGSHRRRERPRCSSGGRGRGDLRGMRAPRDRGPAGRPRRAAGRQVQGRRPAGHAAPGDGRQRLRQRRHRGSPGASHSAGEPGGQGRGPGDHQVQRGAENARMILPPPGARAKVLKNWALPSFLL